MPDFTSIAVHFFLNPFQSAHFYSGFLQSQLLSDLSSKSFPVKEIINRKLYNWIFNSLYHCNCVIAKIQN